MSTSIRIRRKNAFNLLKEAERLQSFDEFPLLRPEVDPQLHVSRNSADQPFFLVLEKDCVIGQMTGASRVHFHDENVRWFDVGPGEFVYVPAGAGHRVFTREPGVMIRYKAQSPGRERVFWLCEACGGDVFAHEWDATSEVSQRGQQAGLNAFNADARNRTCQACGLVHEAVDAAPFRFEEVARTLEQGEEEDF